MLSAGVPRAPPRRRRVSYVAWGPAARRRRRSADGRDDLVRHGSDDELQVLVSPLRGLGHVRLLNCFWRRWAVAIYLHGLAGVSPRRRFDIRTGAHFTAILPSVARGRPGITKKPTTTKPKKPRCSSSRIASKDQSKPTTSPRDVTLLRQASLRFLGDARRVADVWVSRGGRLR